jgi:hypothetical protein
MRVCLTGFPPPGALMPVVKERDSVMPVRIRSLDVLLLTAVYNKILAPTIRNCTYMYEMEVAYY